MIGTCVCCKAEDVIIGGKIDGLPYCDDCFDGMTEQIADGLGPDPHGYRDPTPEQEAGWAFEDKLDMYRNEY